MCRSLPLYLFFLLLGCGSRSGLVDDGWGRPRADAGLLDGGRDAPPAGPCGWSAAEPEVAHRLAAPFTELHVGDLTPGSSNALLVWYEATPIFGGDPRVRYGARAIGFDGVPIAAEQVLSNEPILPGGFGAPRIRAVARAEGFALASFLGRNHPTLAPGVLLETDPLGAVVRSSRLELPIESQWNETHRVGEAYRLFVERFPTLETVELAPDASVVRTSAPSMGRASLRREVRADGIAVELLRIDPVGDAGFLLQAFDFEGSPQWASPIRIEESFSSIGVLTFTASSELTILAHSLRSGSALVLEAVDGEGMRVWRAELGLPDGNLGGALALAEGELLVLITRGGTDSRELFVASVALDGSILSELRSVWSGPGSAVLSSLAPVPGGAIAGGQEFAAGELRAIVQGLRCTRR